MLLSADSDPDGDPAFHLFANGGDDLAHEARASSGVAAPLIATPVECRRQERLRKGLVGAVDLHTVRAGVCECSGGGGVGADHMLDLGGVERVGNRVVGLDEGHR